MRPALIGAMVGVLGVVGAMTIDHGLSEALTHPARAGVTWDAAITPSPADTSVPRSPARESHAIAAVRDVSDVAVVSRQVSEVAGTAGVQIFAIEPKIGSVALETTKGTGPKHDDEAAIGPQTARLLGVGIGDTITVGSLPHRVRIVGEALFPCDVHASFDEGIWLTPKHLRDDRARLESDRAQPNERPRRALPRRRRQAAAFARLVQAEGNIGREHRATRRPARALQPSQRPVAPETADGFPRRSSPRPPSRTCSPHRYAGGGATSRCCARSA